MTSPSVRDEVMHDSGLPSPSPSSLETSLSFSKSAMSFSTACSSNSTSSSNTSGSSSTDSHVLTTCRTSCSERLIRRENSVPHRSEIRPKGEWGGGGVATTPSLKGCTIAAGHRSQAVAPPEKHLPGCRHRHAEKTRKLRLTVSGRLCAAAGLAIAFSLILWMFGFPAARTKRVVPKVVTDRTSTVHPSRTITVDATCSDWAAWIPSRSKPAVVMQVVSKDYIDVTRNFIRLMERNSALNRHHLFLMCMDDESLAFFERSMGIRCVPMSAFDLPTHQDIWKLRVRVVSCLLEVGRVDVIMSDADALWLGDPAQELFGGAPFLPPGGDGGEGGGDCIRDSDVVASRGTYPYDLGEAWGSTICMGFVLLRTKNTAAMKEFLDVMKGLVLETEDDQVSINRAARQLGVVWDKGNDMRFENSTGLGVGKISSLPADDNGRPFGIALLPHSTYTRLCSHTPISAETTVAHCYFGEKRAGVKTWWMEKAHLWSVQKDP